MMGFGTCGGVMTRKELEGLGLNEETIGQLSDQWIATYSTGMQSDSVQLLTREDHKTPVSFKEIIDFQLALPELLSEKTGKSPLEIDAFFIKRHVRLGHIPALQSTT